MYGLLSEHGADLALDWLEFLDLRHVATSIRDWVTSCQRLSTPKLPLTRSHLSLRGVVWREIAA